MNGIMNGSIAQRFSPIRLVVGAFVAMVLLLGGIQFVTIAHNSSVSNALLGSNRASICVLVIPNPPDSGRDEGRVNSVCLIPNGLPAFDVNGDGDIELAP